MPEWNELTDYISRLAKVHKSEKALCYGSYRKVFLTNRQIVFERSFEGERILVAINLEENPFHASFDAGAAEAVDLLTGEKAAFQGGLDMPAFSAAYLKITE